MGPLLHMETIGLTSQIPVFLPVGEFCPDWITALLLDHLCYQLRRRHVYYVERSKLRAPDWSIQTFVFNLDDGEEWFGVCIR